MTLSKEAIASLDSIITHFNITRSEAVERIVWGDKEIEEFMSGKD